MPIHGINNGTIPVIGFNHGAGKHDRVRKAIKFSVSATMVYTAVMWAVIMLIPALLLRIFNQEAELITAGIPAMRIYFSLFIFMSMHMSSQIVFVGIGRSKNAIFFSLLRKAFIAVPLTVLFPLFGTGTNGVFAAEAVSQFISGIACFSTMYIVVYRKSQGAEKLRS
jgi:Na+-driven multidrug efflux pump